MPARFAVYLPQSIRQISRVEFDLQNKPGLFEAFEGSYDPGPPPMVALLLMVARTIYDPVDWVMTGIEVIQDIQRGDYGSAALNFTLGVTPFLTSSADNLIEAGRHLPFQEALGDNSPLIAFIFDYWSRRGARFGADDVSNGGSAAGRANNLIAGSPEHKAARWTEYQANPDNAGWNYERWSQNYDLNMTRAREAQERVVEYQGILGWGTTDQVTLTTRLGGRRLDIIDVERTRGIEFKSGNYFHQDPEIRAEVAKDALLVQRGWEITWVFEADEGVSAPLLEALDDAGITVIVNGVPYEP